MSQSFTRRSALGLLSAAALSGCTQARPVDGVRSRQDTSSHGLEWKLELIAEVVRFFKQSVELPEGFYSRIDHNAKKHVSVYTSAIERVAPSEFGSRYGHESFETIQDAQQYIVERENKDVTTVLYLAPANSGDQQVPLRVLTYSPLEIIHIVLHEATHQFGLWKWPDITDGVADAIALRGAVDFAKSTGVVDVEAALEYRARIECAYNALNDAFNTIQHSKKSAREIIPLVSEHIRQKIENADSSLLQDRFGFTPSTALFMRSYQYTFLYPRLQAGYDGSTCLHEQTGGGSIKTGIFGVFEEAYKVYKNRYSGKEKSPVDVELSQTEMGAWKVHETV